MLHLVVYMINNKIQFHRKTIQSKKSRSKGDGGHANWNNQWVQIMVKVTHIPFIPPPNDESNKRLSNAIWPDHAKFARYSNVKVVYEFKFFIFLGSTSIARLPGKTQSSYLLDFHASLIYHSISHENKYKAFPLHFCRLFLVI